MKFDVAKTVKTAGAAIQKIGGRGLLKVRKASPELMLAGGIALGVGCVVTACIATKKVDAVIEETHEELDAIYEEYSEETGSKDEKKDNFKAYMHAGWKFIKLYSVPAALGGASVALILSSHGVLKNRYLGATAAYTALDEAFKDYRKRIAAIAGEDSEKRFFNGTEDGLELEVLDSETGEKKKVKGVSKAAVRKKCPYEFDWNRTTAPTCWSPNDDQTLFFLKAQQSYLNDLLNARGHVFLNEALDAIGLNRTPEGALTGWLKGSGGDDFVDFGIQDFYSDEYCEQNVYSKNIHLNFNVDGIIWDKI